MAALTELADKLASLHSIPPVPVNGKQPMGGVGWPLLPLQDRLLITSAPLCTGVGIQAGGPVFHPRRGAVEVRILDCDIYDSPTQSAFAFGFLGALAPHAAKQILWRWGRGPACVLFTHPGSGLHEHYGRLNGKPAIQLLGSGKQAVWWGTHPETGTEYRHPDGDLFSIDPPFIEPDALLRAVETGLQAAGIPLATPTNSVSTADVISPQDIAALTPQVLERYRAELGALVSDACSRPDGSGIGHQLFSIGAKYGALIKASLAAPLLTDSARRIADYVEIAPVDNAALRELGRFADHAFTLLSGSLGAGRQRNFARGVAMSKGISQQGVAQRAQQTQQLLSPFQAARPYVVDTLKLDVRSAHPVESLRYLLSKPISKAHHRIEGLVPDAGVFLIVADPKAGKSYVASDMALAIGEGGEFAGRSCRRCHVMYFALEETDEQSVSRMRHLRPGGLSESVQDAVSLQYFDGGVPHLGSDFRGGLLEYLDDQLAAHPDTGVVILDTMHHALGDIEGNTRNKNAYKIEYSAVSVLQAYALSRKISIIVLHHTRKSAGDSIGHRVSGSQGLTAAANGYIVLKIDETDPYTMEVKGTVRGIGIVSDRWTRTEDSAVWKPIELPTSNATYPGKNTAKDKIWHAIIACNHEITPGELANKTGLDERVVAARCGDLRREGKIQQPRRGVYCAPGAIPRLEAIQHAIVRAGAPKPITQDVRQQHDPEDRHHDAKFWAYEADVIAAIENAGFQSAKAAIADLAVRKLVIIKAGIVWFYGATWDAPTFSGTPWSLKMPWEV